MREDLATFMKRHENVNESNDDYLRDIVQQVAITAKQTEDASIIFGKRRALQDFLNHIRSRPSAGITDIWFKNRSSDLLEEARLHDQAQSAFNQEIKSGSITYAEWVSKLEVITKGRGELIGYIGELKSLSDQVVSYYAELDSANRADMQAAQQRAAALYALGNSLSQWSYQQQQNNYQQQILNSLNRPRTCSQYGSSITCN